MAVTEKDFTLSWGDITIGAPNTIAVTRPSSQYSFRFRCEFQGVTINLTAPELMIISQDDTRVVFQWTPDESLSLAIPDSVSGTGTLTMTVAYTSRFEQLSNPEFCVKTYDFTAYVPDSMRPSATLTVALVNDNALLEQWGLWVRGMSCLQYAVEASAVGGATLKSCRFTFAGQTVSGFSGVTAPIGMAGTLTPAAVVTDSRGRTTTVSAAPVAVFDYQTPSLRAFGSLPVQRRRCRGQRRRVSAGKGRWLLLAAGWPQHRDTAGPLPPGGRRVRRLHHAGQRSDRADRGFAGQGHHL